MRPMDSVRFCMVQLESLLRRHDWPLGSIDVFAAAAGPGSFTGVRVGLTAAKGLADAMGRGAVAVSNLQALAAFGVSDARGVVMDARRGEIYAAVYDANLQPLAPEIVTTFPRGCRTCRENPKRSSRPTFPPFAQVSPSKAYRSSNNERWRQQSRGLPRPHQRRIRPSSTQTMCAGRMPSCSGQTNKH